MVTKVEITKEPDITAEENQSQSITDIEEAIEAILYAAGYPISYAKLAEVLGINLRDVKRIVKHMSEKFDNGHGITLLTFDDSCQFCTREQYAPYIREALGIRRGGNLSASSMEVLAVVAYNQPVTRSFIDTVRGVDSSYAVNSLIDKNLIESCGRLEAPGRPMLYGTTENFLRVFGISSLTELPEVEPIPDVPEVAVQTTIDDTEGLDIQTEKTEENPEKTNSED